MSDPKQMQTAGNKKRASGTPGDRVREAGNRESSRMRRAAILEEAAELRRLNRDLADRLELLRTEAERRAAEARAVLSAVERLRGLLDEAPQVPEDVGEDAAALGPARRALERIRIEIVKIEHAAGDTGNRVQAMPDLGSLSWGQLLRFGLGLTWPVALALLAGAFAICVVLVRLFAG